jgi:aldehyde dehydrogenase (NAD+)
MWQGEFDKLFIGGKWVVPLSDDIINVVSPFSEKVLATVPHASKEDVDRAVSVARDAFERGPWRRWSLEKRVGVLHALGERVTNSRELFASILTEEMGAPIAQTIGQADRSVDLIETFSALAKVYPFSSIVKSASGNALVTREPIGVLAIVVPWNAPLLISIIHMIPALLAGNSVIIKTSPETPIDAYLLGELIEDLGIPEGVVSIVPADREVSEYLVTRPGVDMVAFTGSSAAGKRVASLCGASLKPAHLELGGKSAAIILDDADLASTAETLRMGALRNNGQVCQLPTRLLISRHREEEFLECLSEMVLTMPVGDPRDPRTQIGPLVSRRQRDRVEGYIEVGRREGANVVTGGGRPAEFKNGWFVEPTIFRNVRRDMTIAREEIFGPVLAVMCYEDDEEAIEIANDSSFGLSGGVFSSDHRRALNVAQQLNTGGVLINNHPIGWHAPYGGWKDSGIGRVSGLEAFDEVCQTRSIGLTPELLAELSSLEALPSLALSRNSPTRLPSDAESFK